MHAPAIAASGHRPRATPTAIIAVTASSGEVETLAAENVKRIVHGRALYIVANHYSGGGASDGVVLVEPVTVPRAGRP